MNDKDIIELFLARNESALTETDLKFHKYCLKTAMNILGNENDAEEAVNESYLGLWNSIPPHIPENLASYLGRITRNISLKILRSRKSKKHGGGEAELVFDELEECVKSSQNVEKSIEMNELGDFVNKFLEQLPDTERRVFMCRYWYFDSIADISKHFGFSQSKVKSMLMRTRKKLRKMLEKEEII